MKQETWTPKQYQEHLHGKGKRRSKYGSTRVQSGGYTFDSKKEAKRFGELQILQQTGRIHDLQIHVRYALKVAPHLFLAHEVVVGHYTADFSYIVTATGEEVIEDVKSPITRKATAYRLRKKLFEALTGKRITEV
jgi:hypothetical protein